MFLACFLTGCAALPLESAAIPHPSSRVEREVGRQYQEAVGVIHVHSTYSDGTGSIESIARIGNLQGLDYILVTDHDTLRGKREGREGRYGKTWILIGEEVSTQGGHYLALRTNKEIPRLQDPRWTIEAISAQGGLGFIAHPVWPRRPWTAADARGMTGLEIYSAKEDVAEEDPLWLGFWTILTGSEFSQAFWLDRPDASLALWDRMLVEGDRVVGIGAVDAHGLRRFGLRLGPYATTFKLVRTHLLLEAWNPEAIYDALEKGHAFVAHELIADARGFRFVAAREGAVQGVMGDRVPWHRALRLYAYLPSPGEMTLFKDGKQIAQVEGQSHWFDVSGPGVYRLEATRKGKPWIYSNPIYVIE